MSTNSEVANAKEAGMMLLAELKNLGLATSKLAAKAIKGVTSASDDSKP